MKNKKKKITLETVAWWSYTCLCIICLLKWGSLWWRLITTCKPCPHDSNHIVFCIGNLTLHRGGGSKEGEEGASGRVSIETILTAV